MKIMSRFDQKMPTIQGMKAVAASWLLLTLIGWGLPGAAQAQAGPSPAAGPELAHRPEPPAKMPPGTGTAEARFGLKFQPLNFAPPKTEHATLANGVTLDFYAEPDIPLVNVLVRLGVGSLNDPAGKVGAAALTAEVIRTGGSTTLSGDELDRQLESRGAQLSVETTREETWFRLSLLKEDFAWGMNLLRDILTHPAFPQNKLDEARALKLVDLQQRLDVPQTIAQYLYPQLVYTKGNPWGWTATDTTIKAISLDDIKAVYQNYYRPENGKLGISGDATWEQVRQLADQTFGSLPASGMEKPESPTVAPVASTQIYIVPRDKIQPVTQNVIYLGHEGINRFDPDKFPIKVFNNVLSGGFTSRMFKEIRSDRGLAHAVYGAITEGTQKGLFFNVALTKVPSSGEAIDLMMKIDKDLTQAPPTTEEVNLAKQAEVNSFVFFFDSAEKIVRQRITLDAFGYPPDYLETYVTKLRAVTPAQVEEAAKAHLHLDHVVVLVVGKVDGELRKQLEAIGPVREISPEELRQQWL